jgi:hypothetical protein
MNDRNDNADHSINTVCRDRFPRQVTLLHDYPLYEFTILVRK